MSSALWKPAEFVRASTHHDEADAFRFERRSIDRWSIAGAATAFRLCGQSFGRMHDLTMIDFSHDGMGAVSDSVIEPGATVSIGFQSPGYVAKRGTVLRCTPCGAGYRVAIQFHARLAA